MKARRAQLWVSYGGLLAVALVAGGLAYWVAVPSVAQRAPLPTAVGVRSTANAAASNGAALRMQPALVRASRPRVHHLAPLAVDKPTLEKPTVEKPTVEKPTVDKPTLEKPTLEKPTMPDATAVAAALASDDSTDRRPQTAEESAEEDAASHEADQVRFVIHAHLPQIRACYERAFKRDESSPGGRVEVGFRITVRDDVGRAADVHVESDSSGSPSLGPCICGAVGSWTFARPAHGDFALTYPFLFSRGS